MIKPEMAFATVCTSFPSPHSGILFLSLQWCGWKALRHGNGFRPLIRGFFFYAIATGHAYVTDDAMVSVPSFGDSFFIRREREETFNQRGWFPSPHSGILFL